MKKRSHHSPDALAFKYARATLDKTQKEMAAMLKCHQSTLSKIERGTFMPGDVLVERLYDVTGQSSDSLLQNAVKTIREYAPSFKVAQS